MWANLWLQSWREEEHPAIVPQDEKNKGLREVLRGNAALLRTEMRDGTAGIMHAVSGGTKVSVWVYCESEGRRCDLFSTLLNPFLVLQPSPSFKENKNVFQRSSVYLFKIICKFCP